MSNAARIGALCHANIPKVSSELFTLTYGALVNQLIKDNDNNCTKVNDKLFELGFDMGLRMVDELLAVSNIRSCRTFTTTMEVVAKVGFKMFLGITPELSIVSRNNFLDGGNGNVGNGEINLGSPTSKHDLNLSNIRTVESASISLKSLNANVNSLNLNESNKNDVMESSSGVHGVVTSEAIRSEIQDAKSTSTTTVSSNEQNKGVNAASGPANVKYILSFKENPLEDFVELPEHFIDLKYSNILCGAVNGALESLNIKTKCQVVNDKLQSILKNDLAADEMKLTEEEKQQNVTKIEVVFIEFIEDEAGDEYKEE